MNGYIIASVAGVVVIGFYGIYVSLIKKKNNLKEAASGIDVQLKKRYDLIPNLLKSAAKFMEHEKDIFMEVTALREQAMVAQSYDERFKVEQKLSQAMHAFQLTAENYPQLKSDATMVNAMQAMTETEEHIAAARRFYNSAVKDYKNGLEIFPFSAVAAMMGMKDDYPFFETEEAAKESIDVSTYFN